MSAFHAYDIRGIWNKDFNAATVYEIGRAMPEILGAPDEKREIKSVLVGRDARASSPEIFAALAAGLADAGAQVFDLGFCTTPATYFFAGGGDYDVAAMITASHNGPEYNGLKISRRGGIPVGADSGLKDIERLVDARLASGAAWRADAARQPAVVDVSPRKSEYAAFLKSNLPDLGGLRAIVDFSSGMGSLYAKELWGEFGFEFMFDEIDGTFARHSPNPLLPETSEPLRKEVVARGADVGVIFDGDADRVMFVDEKGAFVRPDLITAVLAEYYLAKEPGASVLCDIRTSRAVAERVEELGGTAHLWKVGHAFAKAKLRELGAVVGGELAGHYYFRDFFCCDSALLCAQIVLGVAAKNKRAGVAFSDMISAIAKYPSTGELNYTIDDKSAAAQALSAWAENAPVPPRKKYDFDGFRYEWPDWWFNIRESNTEPYLRLVAEADGTKLLAEKKDAIESILKPFISAVEHKHHGCRCADAEAPMGAGA